MKFYPYEKGGGAETVFSHAEGGHNKLWGSFSHIEGEGAKSFHSLKGGRKKFHPVLRGRGWGGGGQTVSDTIFSHFVAPLPVISDQPLMVLFLFGWAQYTRSDRENQSFNHFDGNSHTHGTCLSSVSKSLHSSNTSLAREWRYGFPPHSPHISSVVNRDIPELADPCHN